MSMENKPYDPGWNPDYDFLYDPELKEIDGFLDESIYSGNTKEKRNLELEKFKAAIKKLMSSLPEIAKTDMLKLRRIILFSIKYTIILDKGGMNRGRSEQSNILVVLNEYLITNFPDIYNEIEKKGTL